MFQMSKKKLGMYVPCMVNYTGSSIITTTYLGSTDTLSNWDNDKNPDLRVEYLTVVHC